MNALICIDDTDNYDSIGTGELLENMIADMDKKGLCKGDFVTRHQLYIHEDIDYTSHNSSMCILISTDDINAVSTFAKEYIEKRAAKGSDPGLCIARLLDDIDYSMIIDYAMMAKITVLDKQDAYNTVALYNGTIELSEHGGSGDGIIGALAGVGLRLSGNDGRIKGKLKPKADKDILTVEEICEDYPVEQVIDEENNKLSKDTKIHFTMPCKVRLRDYKRTLVVIKKEDGSYEPKPKRNNNKDK